MEVLPLKQLIDIHSHILPGVDDGCQSEEEALDMLKMYEDQGVEAVICTPHFGPCGLPGANVDEAYRKLASAPSNVKLYLGNEILFTQSTVNDVRHKLARTLAGSKYILVEFEEWLYSTSAASILRCMNWLSKSEFTPILAHPERYRSLQDYPLYYRDIKNTGTLFQVNAYDIEDNKDPNVRVIAQYLLRNGMVSYIGSDAHGAHRRSPQVQNGIKWIYDHLPEDYADAIVHDNAAKIIGGA